MLIEVVLTIIAIIGVVLQYRSEHTNIEEAKRKKYGFVLMVISILGFWGANISKYVESQESSNDIKILKVSNDTLLGKLDSSNQKLMHLDTELKSIQTKNDSLLAANEILKAILESTKQDISILNTRTLEGFAQSQKSIETIGKASGARIISSADKKKMGHILSTQKGKIHFELTTNDQEVLQYAEQLKELFRFSGWQVTNKYDYPMVNPPLKGLEVLIKKSDNIPIGIEKVIDAFNVVGLKYKAFYVGENDQRRSDYVYILVGYQ